MNYLAISLHRLGDLLMHAHILKSLKTQRELSLTLFTHPFFSSIEFLFPFIEQTLIFQRDWCQKSIGEDFFNKEWSLRHINSLLDKLNQRTFDVAIDLSQTETSARWMTGVLANHKIGVGYISDDKQKSFLSKNPYIHYLHTLPRSRLHFVDLLKKSLDLPLERLPIAHSPQSKSRLILFQTLSSDIKKNWPSKKWCMLLERLAIDLPHHQLGVISSPSELKDLQKIFRHLPANCTVIPTSIKECFDLLKTAELLVSLDTAIKHLATWTHTPILELALGSSCATETGAYQEDAWVIQPPTTCHPCRHSQRCSQKSFVCHEDISVDLVYRATIEKLRAIKHGDGRLLFPIELNSVQTVRQNNHGWWHLTPLLQESEKSHGRRNKESIEVSNQAY